MAIVGLLGGEGAGKTTAANYLEQKYGAKRYTLAAPLKEFVKRVFELSDEQVYGTQEQKNTIDPRYGVTPRWLMQRVGTEGFQVMMGKQFWTEYLLKQLRKDNPKLAVIDDVRFAHEVDGLRDALIVKLVNKKRPVTGTHASETEWVTAYNDHTIEHDGEDLAYLYNELDKCLLKAIVRM